MAEKTTAFTGPVVVGLNDKKGEIRLTDGKNVNEAKYLSIAAPDTITSDTTLTFPNGAGTAGQILSTDGSGNLSWVNDSAGNPAGTNGQVQTNDGGTFGAISEGTANQVLTSNGAGSAPTFQAAPSPSTVDVDGSNIFISDDPAPNRTTAINNTSVGVNALASITNAAENVAIGNSALESKSTSGSGACIAIGFNALEVNTSGGSNTAVGRRCMNQNITGNNNTAMGDQALYRNNANDNTAIGHDAMRNNVSGQQNTIVGNNAGVDLTGNSNTAIGSSAGSSLTSGQNNTLLGASAQPSTATVSNEVTIGNSSVTSLRIPGLQSGASSGDVLTFDGTDIGLAAPAAGGTDWQPVITTNTTATASQGFFVNTSGGAVTLTLPATPTRGDEVSFVDYAGTAATNNITIGRNGENIQGSASDLIINTNRAANTLVYADSTQGWLLKNV